MSDTTIDVNGVAVPAEEAEEALDDLDDKQNGVACSGDTVVMGDGDDDNAVQIADTESGERSSYIFDDDLREKIEDATDDGHEGLVIGFESRHGSELRLPLTADFEVVKKSDGGNTHVVGTNQSSVTNGITLNGSPDRVLDGDWDGDWYFSEGRIIEE